MTCTAVTSAATTACSYFGSVSMTIVGDRTKTVVRRHVAPGEAVPLHPEEVGFADPYDFDIDVLAAYRPTGKDVSSGGSSSSETMSCPAGPFLPRGDGRCLHHLGAAAMGSGPQDSLADHRRADGL
ncbi:hypothetical protein [Streptomyces sp. NPDC016675]|uniref:hypothetical protein n=1 Tax=Streptomyces sp. NPDC016675 TaxID=3364970 RepID=UPI0036F627CB